MSKRLFWLFACFLFAACDDDGGGGAAPTEDAQVSDGMIAPDAGEEPDADLCEEGRLGCACTAENTCTTGECVEGTCTECDRGSLGCACLETGGCDMGGTCDEAGICVECPAGDEGCACGFNDFCAIGLTCQQGVCAAPPCPAGTETCPCNEGSCDPGLACNDDSICYACANDMAGCPCVEGECADNLYCDNDTCRDPQTCEELGCGDNRLCTEPENEGDRPVCQDACAEGYFFDADTATCIEIIGASCTEGAPNSIAERCAAQNRACTEMVPDAAECGACLEGNRDVDGACVAIVTCAELNCAAAARVCTEATPMADARCDVCVEGFVDQNGECVELTCDVLGCAAQNRQCVDGPACGECNPGFEAVDGVCQPFVPPTCNPEDEVNIAAACAAQNRACVDDGAMAQCGNCLQGFAQDPQSGECRAAVFCADLNCAAEGRVCDGEPFAACGACEPGTVEENGVCVRHLTCEDIACMDGEFCIEGDLNTDAYCNDRPCPEGEALREQGVGGVCVRCDIACNGTGETGNYWPYTLANSDECLCETEPGFYADISLAILALPCDEDGDGWVRTSARRALESDDPAILANARCGLRTIDSVELRNDLGQQRVLQICESGLVPEEDGPCETAVAVGLYESERNDSPIDLARANPVDVPPLAENGVGRSLRAEELNSAVRYCVSPRADYNDNGTTDANEAQNGEPVADLDPSVAFFQSVGFFGELAQGWFQAPGEDAPFGRWIIAERSRCSQRFAVGYVESDGDYWRGCTANRDSAYDAAIPAPGFDFAQFNCDAQTGSCPLPPPVADPRPVPGAIAPHDRCAVQPPQDGIWRGMNLHSQFKCVTVTSAMDLPEDRSAAPQLQPPTALYDGATNSRKLQFNSCRVACPDGDPECAADCEGERCATSSAQRGGLSNPAEPVLTCTPVLQVDDAITVGRTGLAAVRYNEAEGDYVRGCLNEWTPTGVGAQDEPWKALCPGYADAPERIVAQANAGNFGRLICGCGLNYGGPGCAVGCPQSFADLDGDGNLESDVGPLFYGGDPANVGGDCANGYCPTDGRRGYWVCGGFNATTLEGDDGDPNVGVLQGGRFMLHGGITVQPFESGALCEGEDCNQGYSVRPVHPSDRLP